MAAEPSQPNIPEPDTSAEALDDEGIYCPICHYNLTGLPSGRCPECGSLFHKDQLREAQIVELDALIPWDRPDIESWWKAFWSTAYITCGQPRRFTFAFSVQPQKTRAAGYYHLCLFIAAVTLAIPHGLAAYVGSQYSNPGAFLASFIVLLGTVVLGRWVWALVYAALILHVDGQRHYSPWRAIVQYSAGHLLLFVPMSLFCGLVPILFGAYNDAVFFVIIVLHLGAMGVFLLWYFTLDAVLRCRGSEHVNAHVAGWLTLFGGPTLYVTVWIATATALEFLGVLL